MTRRSRPVWIWIVATVVAVLVLYVASFGPACWIMTQREAGRHLVAAVYRPVFLAVGHGPIPVSRALYWYANVGIPDDRVIVVPNADEDGIMRMGLLIPR